MTTASEHVVLAWKIDPVKGLMTVYENPKSSEPGRDLERTLELDPGLVTIDALGEDDAASMKREFIDDYTRVGARDITGKYVEGPLLDGVRSYSVHGFVPTGRPHPVEKGRMLNRVGLRVGMSSNPRQDVERALMVGCTSVTVALNYEPSEVEKYEQEEFDRQERRNPRRREEFIRKQRR